MADTPDALIRRWFEEVWNQGLEQTIDELVAAGAKIHGLATPDGRPISGPEEFTGSGSPTDSLSKVGISSTF
jgi:hypothetical protein